MPKKEKKVLSQEGSERMERRCYDLRKRGLSFTQIEKQLKMPDRNGNGAWERVLRAEQRWGPLPFEVSILRKRNSNMQTVKGNPRRARRPKPQVTPLSARRDSLRQSRAGSPEPAELSPEPEPKPSRIEDDLIEKAAYRKLKEILVRTLVEVERKIGT